ncbi:hypothetical protein EB796_012536 [Bugula neritina]|uniref:Uncharacterized protein n=1 Tax=Bugula neritina TaxID=10212 RepID=A0A7J7JS15_BUGNE|nr:hypothetical protein EB796_012536 [Bugula neritina]
MSFFICRAEFSTVAFRFGHSLIRQTFSHSGHHLDLKNVFEAYKTTERYGTNGMLRGVISDRIEACDRFVTKGVRNDLFGMEMDLISFNVQRARDHGISSYNDIRRALKLHVYTDWNAMAGSTHSLTMVNDFKKVYPHSEDIEAYPGGMTETPVPGGVVGETFAHIIAMQFKMLRYGDRFWHETPDQKIGFTDAQLAEIRKATFAMLFCEHVPNARVRNN